MNTIFVIDDHPVMRRGYISIIERDSQLKVCGEAGSGEEALEKIPKTNPDLAIVDISLDGMDGIELIQQMQTREWDLATLVISMHDELFFVDRAFEVGAQGYMIKDEGGASLVEAIKQVLQGNRYLSPHFQPM